MLRDSIRKDFWVKLVSLLAALVIWATIKISISNPMQPVETRESSPLDARVLHKVPVAVLKAPGDARVFTLAPATVDVTVSAPFDVMRTLGPRDFEAFINLTDSKDSNGRFKPVNVRVPEGVALLNVEPREVIISVANTTAPNAITNSATNP